MLGLLYHVLLIFFVTRVCLSLSSETPYVFNELQVICTVRKYILTGGPKRLPFTVPPLVFSALKVCCLFAYHMYVTAKNFEVLRLLL